MVKNSLSPEWRDASSVRNIKEFLKVTTPDTRVVQWLESDRRSGVRALARQISAKLARSEKERIRLQGLLTFEKALLGEGYRAIAGVDEVGAGPLAGPVVAAAVLMDFTSPIEDVKDSKRLSERQRSRIELQIKDSAYSYAFGWVEAEEIDEINVYQASLLAMHRAVENLSPAPDYLLVDARTIPDVRCPQKAIIGGDNLSYAIAAASILAKQERDRFMVEMDERYPNYGFGGHKGYGTARHLKALKRLGPCPLHRKSFAPVAAALL